MRSFRIEGPAGTRRPDPGSPRRSANARTAACRGARTYREMRQRRGSESGRREIEQTATVLYRSLGIACCHRMVWAYQKAVYHAGITKFPRLIWYSPMPTNIRKNMPGRSSVPPVTLMASVL